MTRPSYIHTYEEHPTGGGNDRSIQSIDPVATSPVVVVTRRAIDSIVVPGDGRRERTVLHSGRARGFIHARGGGARALVVVRPN